MIVVEPLDFPQQSCTLLRTGPQTCPICAAELADAAATESALYPFCSRRCKLIDLHRWTEGRYAIVETLTIEKLLEEQARGAVDAAGDAE